MQLRAQVTPDQLVAIRIGVRLRGPRTTRFIGGPLVLQVAHLVPSLGVSAHSY
jgi:hypothetical protein